MASGASFFYLWQEDRSWEEGKVELKSESAHITTRPCSRSWRLSTPMDSRGEPSSLFVEIIRSRTFECKRFFNCNELLVHPTHRVSLLRGSEQVLCLAKPEELHSRSNDPMKPSLIPRRIVVTRTRRANWIAESFSTILPITRSWFSMIQHATG